jgi:hypothetical protein
LTHTGKVCAIMDRPTRALERANARLIAAAKEMSAAMAQHAAAMAACAEAHDVPALKTKGHA